MEASDKLEEHRYKHHTSVRKPEALAGNKVQTSVAADCVRCSLMFLEFFTLDIVFSSFMTMLMCYSI